MTLARRSSISISAALALCLLATGCAAPQAVVYPRGTATARQQAHTMLGRCELQAREAVGAHGGLRQVLSRSGTKAAQEAAEAATTGYIDKVTDLALAAGTAGAGGLANQLVKEILTWNRPDKVYEKYVELCMKERGHEVLGWR